MTEHRRLLLLGNHLLVAKAWCEHGDKTQADSIWKTAVSRGLVTTFRQRLLKLYIFNYPTLIAPFMYYVLYHILPEAVFVSRRFSIKFEPDYVDGRPVKPHSAMRGPLYNHSGIVEKGLVRYIRDAFLAIIARHGSTV